MCGGCSHVSPQLEKMITASFNLGKAVTSMHVPVCLAEVPVRYVTKLECRQSGLMPWDNFLSMILLSLYMASNIVNSTHVLL